MIKRKRRQDNRSPCLKPQELPKKPTGDPLTKTEKQAVDRIKHPNSHDHKLFQYLTYKPLLEYETSVCYQGLTPRSQK